MVSVVLKLFYCYAFSADLESRRRPLICPPVYDEDFSEECLVMRLGNWASFVSLFVMTTFTLKIKQLLLRQFPKNPSIGHVGR